MMERVISTETLNERERAYLEHVKRAQGQGVSLSEYCRKAGLKVQKWYSIKSGLIKRGVLAGRRSQAHARAQVSADRGRSSSAFIPVRVAAPLAEVICRIRHPHGWVLECMRMPEPKWVLALMAEEADAAPVR